MVCKDETLVRRLLDRPGWRKSAEPETLSRMIAFNRWLSEKAGQTQPPMALLDTTDLSVEQGTEHVVAWIHSRLR